MSERKSMPVYTGQSTSLAEQGHRAASRFRESRKIWDAIPKRFIRNVDVYAWRNRFQLMSTAARAFMAIQNPPRECGPTIENWKNMNSKSGTVIRCLGDLVVSSRQTFTISQLEVALPKNFSCVRKSLQNICNRGIELKLLVRGCNSTFSVTELFIAEFYSRTLWRDLNDDIVDWCRQVVMLDDMVKTAIKTTEQEELGELYDSGMRSISERLDMGDYDEEIGFDRDAD